MKTFTLAAAIGALALLIGLSGCSRQEAERAGMSQAEASVVVISKDDLWTRMEEGDIPTIIDVLAPEHFQANHIKGAISMPLNTIERQVPKMLDKEDTIVTYCASYICPVSTYAAEKLMAMGYEKVYDYKGGIKEWMEAGLPVQSGAGGLK